MICKDCSCPLESFLTGLRLYPSDVLAPPIFLCPVCHIERKKFPERRERLLYYPHTEILFAKLLPFLHQFDGVTSLLENPFFLVGDEMGVAKTKQVIDAAQILYMRGIINRVIVFAPSNVRSVWSDPDRGQLKKHLWVPSLVTEYHSKQIQWGDKTGLRWVVTNYEYVRQPREKRKKITVLSRTVKELLPYCTPKTLLVLDESSAVKTDGSQQTNAIQILRKACGRVVLLNGTPMSESTEDLFSQGNIMSPSILECPSKTQFRHRFAIMEDVRRSGGDVLLDPYGRPVQRVKEWRNKEELTRRFAPYVIRRMKKDCLDLPEKLDTVPIPITLKESWPHYKQMRDECLVWLDQANVSQSPQITTKIMRLAQIASGFLGGVEDMDEVIEDEIPAKRVVEVGREKLDYLLQWLQDRLAEEKNFKLIVWSAHRPEIFRAVRELRATFPGDVGVIVGAQKEAERAEAKRLLDPDDAPEGPVVVVSSIAAGGKGTTLTAAACNFYLSNWWSLEKRLQSEDRTHRETQLRAVSYFDAVAVGPRGQKTMDHRFMEIYEKKETLSDEMMASWTPSTWKKLLTDQPF